MQEHIQILELASTNSLPEKIDEYSEISIYAVEELIEAGHLKAIDTSTLQGREYCDTRITLSGREYLKVLKSNDVQKQDKKHKQSEIRLFISHSSADSELVSLLVALFKNALELKNSQIRCTSLDGYRLPGGAKTTEHLRSEVCEADTFVAIISHNSLKSLFVGFELGARWGVDRPLIPLLAPGMTPDKLSAPITELNALSSDNSTQLHQLVNDLAKTLMLIPAKSFEYDPHIQNIINLKNKLHLNTSAPSAVDSNEHNTANDFHDVEYAILRLFAARPGCSMKVSDISSRLGLNSIRVEHYINKLCSQEFLHDSCAMGSPTEYSLKSKGQAFLVEKGIV